MGFVPETTSESPLTAHIIPSVAMKGGIFSLAIKVPEIAPQSALYTANLPLKSAIDDLVKAGVALDAAGTAKETARPRRSKTFIAVWPLSVPGRSDPWCS